MSDKVVLTDGITPEGMELIEAFEALSNEQRAAVIDDLKAKTAQEQKVISESDYELLELISKLSPEQKVICKKAIMNALEELHNSKVWALYDVYMKLPSEQREELYKAVTENKDI